MVRYTTLTWPQAKLQGEFSKDSLAEHSTHGMWDDMRASIARLVAAGPPMEDAARLQDKEVDKIMEVSPLGQEEVRALVYSRW